MNESARHLCDKPVQVKASYWQTPGEERLRFEYDVTTSICNWDGLEAEIYKD